MEKDQGLWEKTIHTFTQRGKAVKQQYPVIPQTGQYFQKKLNGAVCHLLWIGSLARLITK
jgi:hypothetical protein